MLDRVAVSAYDPANVSTMVRRITVRLPPLGTRLVGRPVVSNPPPNYARLCVPIVAAIELLHGSVDPTSFMPERLASPEVESLARKVTAIEVAHPDPNAFYPQHLTLELADGRVIERDILQAWGHPLLPLSPQDREDKFRLCWRLTREQTPANEQALESTIAWLRDLHQARDCTPPLELLGQPTP